MAYVVLARKYRPQSFEDLVGQEHVAKTLAKMSPDGLRWLGEADVDPAVRDVIAAVTPPE